MAKKPFEAGGIAEANTFVDAVDTTKRLAIDVNGTTGVTGTLATAFTTAKTITFPDSTGTVALTSDAPIATPTIEGKLYGYSNATNISRTTLGYQAGNVATGNGGVLVGYFAGQTVSTGTDNTIIGSYAARAITTSSSNTVIGSSAMSSSNGSRNTVVGYYSGSGIGSDNTLIGTAILSPGSGVSNWIAVGDSIASNTTTASGQNNVIVGRRSLYSCTTAASNIIMGNEALLQGTTASNNVVIGHQAATNMTTGANNIVIGHTAAPSAVTVSNEITLGNGSHTSLRIPGLSLTVDSSNPIVQLTSTQTLTNKVIGTTSTTTVSTNTATVVDTNALAGFTTAKYVVSIKQGSKIRSSEIIAQTDGTSVDYTEFGITETGGAMTGILVEAAAVSTNCVLRVTITDAATTNATVKIQEVLI